METTWHYLVNQFINATTKSYKKALKLSNYHDAILKKAKTENPGIPEYTTMYDRYNLVHLAYVDAYNQWKNAGGAQEGQTLNIDQLLVLLLNKIIKWEAQVIGVFDKTSPEYKAIFPNGKYPFNSGYKDTRIMAVQTLATALKPYATLAATYTEVDAFYTTLDDARDNQEGAKGATKAQSEAVEINRLRAMNMQYRNLGLLMDFLGKTPLLIAPFFELSVLRNHLQVLFTGTLEVAEKEAVLIHTFVADDEFKIKLEGAGEVKFYLGSQSLETNSTPLVVNTDLETTYSASVFGDIDFGTHRFLTAVNTGGTEVHYEIELL